MPETKRKASKSKGKAPQSDKDVNESKVTLSLVETFEGGKAASTTSKPTYSPSKQKINDELDAVRRSRGRSPVAKLANQFEKSRSPPPVKSRGRTIIEDSLADEGEGGAVSGAGAIDSSDLGNTADRIVEEDEVSEHDEDPAGISTSLLNSLRPNENLSDGELSEGSKDTVSVSGASSDAETEEEDFQAALQSVEMEEGALTAKKAQDKDIVFAAQLEDEQITANNVKGKVEERKSRVDDRELLMHTTQQEPDEDSLGWGWLLVGAAVIIGLGFTAFHRIKRRP